MPGVLGLANSLVNILYIFCHVHRALWYIYMACVTCNTFV
jgi:hypothetical protein